VSVEVEATGSRGSITAATRNSRRSNSSIRSNRSNTDQIVMGGSDDCGGGGGGSGVFSTVPLPPGIIVKADGNSVTGRVQVCSSVQPLLLPLLSSIHSCNPPPTLLALIVLLRCTVM
jgi:hypothetical protein